MFCDYTHPISATLQDSVNLSAEPLSGSAATLESTAKANAKGLKAPFKRLSGIGDCGLGIHRAQVQTRRRWQPTTTVTIVVGKREVTVISNLNSKNVLAIAKQASGVRNLKTGYLWRPPTATPVMPQRGKRPHCADTSRRSQCQDLEHFAGATFIARRPMLRRATLEHGRPQQTIAFIERRQ